MIARNRQPLARKSRESLPALKSFRCFLACLHGILSRRFQSPDPQIRAWVRDTMGAATRGELSSLLQKEPMELAMKCNDLSRSLVAFDQNSTLVAVVELSLNSWVVAGVVPGLGRDPVKKQ